MATHLTIEPNSVMNAEMIQAEHEWIDQRRELVEGVESDIADGEYVGLGLSGGGIRSAVFNLGLLQALEKFDMLKQVDFLSTVSGGGYIGSCLTWLKTIRPDESPFGDSHDNYLGKPGQVLSWLRTHGKFLTTGDGLSTWSLISALLTGTFINLLVLFPPLLLLIYVLSQDWPLIPSFFPNFHGWLTGFMYGDNDGFGLITIASIVSFCLFVSTSIGYVLSTSVASLRNHQWQRGIRVWQGRFLMFSVIFAVIGTVPIVHALTLKFEHFVITNIDDNTASWKTFVDEIISAITFGSGLITLVLAKPKESEGGTVSKSRKLIFSIGLILLVYGLFLISYDFMKDFSDTRGIVGPTFTDGLFSTIGFKVALVASFLLAIVINVNEISMHRYYRNRLMESFMPTLHTGDDPKHGEQPVNPGTFPVHRAKPASNAPYQIINTSVNMTGSNNIKLQGRGADNFILSPLYCGALSCGYAETREYLDGKLDLATACSISGAAVDPNTYATRSRALSFLMALLNIRLGYWIRNPRFPSKYIPKLSRPRWYVYLFSEMLGSGLNENHDHVHLSDGGHFENLGLYELIRRRCKYIIVSDAGADPDYAFPALAQVIEMVRVDFGTSIDIDIAKLEPAGSKRFSENCFAIGDIHYPGDLEQGQLIYIKPTISRDLPEDIHGYRRSHPLFPQESTANQFFAESQFEAYRELGYRIGRKLCISAKGKSITALFQPAESI